MNPTTIFYAGLCFLAGVFALALAWYVYRKSPVGVGAFLITLLFASSIWALGIGVESIVTGISAKLFWSQIAYLGSVPAPVLFLFFSLTYTRHSSWLTAPAILLLTLIPALTIVFAFTNPWHGLVWNSFTPHPDARSNILIYGHGPWFWVNEGYTFLCVLAAVAVLVHALMRYPHLYRSEAKVIALACVVPVLSSILYVSGYNPFPGMDLTPVAFALTCGFFTIGILRFQFINLIPVARDQVLEHLKDGVLVLDVNQRVVDINHTAREIMGLNLETALGKSVELLFSTWTDIHPASRQELGVSWRSNQEYQLTIAVGWPAPRYYDLSLSELSDSRAHRLGRLLTVRDTTEHHQAQEEIRRLKDFNEGIVQQMTEGIATEDAQGRFTFFNQAALALLGFEADELLGQHWTHLIQPDQQSIVMEANQRRVRGVTDRYEIELETKDGRRIPVLVSGRPQVDPQTGETIGTLAVFTNLTDVKRAEKELANTKALLEAAFEHASIPMVLISAPDGIVHIANTASRQFLGIQDEPDYVGRSMFDLRASWQDISVDGRPVPLEDLPAVRALQGITTRDRELGVIRRDGKLSWESVSATPVYNQQGELIAAFVIFPDITERKRVESAERQQRVLLEALRDTAAALNSTLNPDEVLDRILEAIGKVVPHDAAHISLVGENGEAKIVRSHGYGEAGFRDIELPVKLRIAEFPNLARMLETNEPSVLVEPVGDLEVLRLPLKARVRSSVGSPIIIKGKVTGFINLDSAIPDFYTKEHAERLRAFTEQAAIAIENAHLFEQTSRRAEQLATLNRIGLSITSGLEMERVLHELYEQCRQIFRLDAFSLALLESASDRIVFPIHFFDNRPVVLASKVVGVDAGLAGIIIEKCSSLCIPDLCQPEIRAAYPVSQADEQQGRAYLGVPLILRERALGALILQSRQVRVYSQEDTRLLETIAAQAAVAIENARLFDQMEQLAIQDGLTGVYNRRHFFMTAAVEIERAARYNKVLSVIMIDLDHFKNVNDTYGHQTGDKLLQAIATRFTQSLRRIDIIGRYGGEEFVVLLPETGLEGACLVAERLRNQIADTRVKHNADEVAVTACLGVASLDNSPADVDILLDCADKALYEAKAGGRNQVRVYRGRILNPT